MHLCMIAPELHELATIMQKRMLPSSGKPKNHVAKSSSCANIPTEI